MKKDYPRKFQPKGPSGPSKEDFVFGIRPVLEAIKSGKEIERLLIQKEMNSAQAGELFSLIREHHISVQKVPVEKLNRVTGKNHQGVIAFLSAVSYTSIENLVPFLFEQGKNPLILILDRITDVRNVGAIARSAECLQAHALVVPARESAQLNSDAVKTSAGALNYLPVCRENNLLQTVRFLKESGLQIIACTEKGAEFTDACDFTLPTAIIMGSEENGISIDLLRHADVLAKIPLSGKVESLNVSVAAGIILYEAQCQRLKG